MVVLIIPALIAAGWLLWQLAQLWGKGWGWAVDHFDWLGALGYVVLTPCAVVGLAWAVFGAARFVSAHIDAIGRGIGDLLVVPWFYFLYRLVRGRVREGRETRRRRAGRLTPEEQARADQIAYNQSPTYRTPEEQLMAARHAAKDASAWLTEERRAETAARPRPDPSR